MAFEAPIEDRYKELLRQRIALEGELALARKQHTAELAQVRTRSNRFLLLLLLLPLAWLVFLRKTPPSVSERQLMVERDSLHNELMLVSATKKDSVLYVIKKGDVLADLGRLFFNDPAAGYQIGKDNGIQSRYDEYHLNPNDTLVIRFR
jgi:hypothetical protein